MMSNPPLLYVTLTLIFLFFLLTISNAANYVEDSCKTTRYPDVCIKTLKPKAAEIKTVQVKLAEVALSAAITQAKAAKVTASKSVTAKDKNPALDDCLEGFGGGLQQLEDSTAELESLHTVPAKFAWHKSNAQTWLSSALTSLEDCKNISQVKLPFTEVEQLISIALTFVNAVKQN